MPPSVDTGTGLCYTLCNGVNEGKEEGEAMRKYWLPGVLLGVSLALLLAGGAAMANGLYITADSDCIECWSGPYEPWPMGSTLQLTIGGWNHQGLDMGWEICAPDVCPFPAIFTPPFDNDPCHVQLAIRCPDSGWSADMGSDCGGTTVAPLQLDASPADHYGEWTARLIQHVEGQPDMEAQVAWIVARDCTAFEQEEFVPEPGTILLLGSGLATLAGYATLHWRTRQ
jgi:hypothetical protein